MSRREKPVVVTPITVDNSAVAQSLKGVLCGRCFDHLVASTSGQTATPFEPCGACLPKCITWMRARGMI